MYRLDWQGPNRPPAACLKRTISTGWSPPAMNWGATLSTIVTHGKPTPGRSRFHWIATKGELNKLFPGMSFQTMSYPISCPNPAVKRAAAKRFAVCRGGGQTYNLDVMDRNYVKAFFLEKSRESTGLVKTMINRTCASNGWLIVATHDISDSPTVFGCSPQFFEEVVAYAVGSGAMIFRLFQPGKGFVIPLKCKQRGRPRMMPMPKFPNPARNLTHFGHDCLLLNLRPKPVNFKKCW